MILEKFVAFKCVHDYQIQNLVDTKFVGIFGPTELNKICQLSQGLKLRPIQSHLQLNFFPLRLKCLEKLHICNLFSPLPLSKQKALAVATAATFAKINKEMKNYFVSHC